MNIFVYSGLGVSKESLEATLKMLKTFLSNKYKVLKISSRSLILKNWEDSCRLFVIPGGADIPYTKMLNGAANKKIQRYVRSGGNFLGICAGAYFAGGYVDFAKGSEIEVLGKRELAFFPGSVKGPTLCGFDYKTQEGAQAAEFSWNLDMPFEEGQTFFCYYNGGGHFENVESCSNVTRLASYCNDDKSACMVESAVGSGKALLSSVHFEYDPLDMNDKDKYLKSIIPILVKEDARRVLLVNHLLTRLRLIEN